MALALNVTPILNPRTIDARFLDCGPNLFWDRLIDFLVDSVGVDWVVVEAQCIAPLPLSGSFLLYSFSPIPMIA